MSVQTSGSRTARAVSRGVATLIAAIAWATSTLDESVAAVTEAALAQYRPEASDFQISLIEDGDLTLAEYESSALSYKQCIEAAGHRLTSPFEITGMGKYVFFYVSPYTADAGALPRCWAEHLNVVDRIWSAHVGRLPEFQRIQDEARGAMAVCIREGGVEDFPENPEQFDYIPLFNETHPDYSGHQELYFSCRQRIADEYKLPAFGG